MFVVMWKYKLLTFYSFVEVPQPHDEVARMGQFCRDIGIKGRIYIGPEGISATCTVNPGQYAALRMYLQQTGYFADIPDIEEKWSDVNSHMFEKMIVKYRDEIVALDQQVDPRQVREALQEVKPEEFKDMLDHWSDDYAVLDMRNTYEYKLGHFDHAIPAWTNNFRDVKAMFETYKDLFAQKKKVVMYCTWWVRCEKLWVLLKNNGIDNVYALNGGVVKYINRYNDGKWLGNLYTFDGLVSTKVGDDATHTKIGVCIYTGWKTDNVENCRYSPCNARIICRRKAYKMHGGFCSHECMTKAREDLLIKNDTRDSFDYKVLRAAIKAGSMTHDQAHHLVNQHLDTIIKVKHFVHQTSQKEDIVDRDYLLTWLEKHTV